jgi:hypothetical protein
MVASCVRFESWAGLLQESFGSGCRENGQFQQRERVNDLWPLNRELCGDSGAAGVTDDMRAAHTDVREQRRSVRRMIGDGDRRGCVRAAHPTTLVVGD